MKDGNEVWRVEIRSFEYTSEENEYYVFAKSAGMAEKAGLVRARKDEIIKPYCKSAEFHCYVY